LAITPNTDAASSNRYRYFGAFSVFLYQSTKPKE